MTEDGALPLELRGGPAARRPALRAKAPGAVAEHLPVARVAVDSGLAHLDRPFDYAVPAAAAGDAVPGVRVRVRFAGRLVDGWLLERVDSTEHAGRLTPLSVVSAEPVLTAEVAALARRVADRGAGTLADVLRLAIPPRHARVEGERDRAAAVAAAAEQPIPEPDAAVPTQPARVPSATAPSATAPSATAPSATAPSATAPSATAPSPTAGSPAVPPAASSWDRYAAGAGFLSALADGRSPRAVWTALPGPTWPDEVAAAVRACAASGRGAVVVVPDSRDLDRVTGALAEAGVPAASLSADLGPAERYRRWLSVLRGDVRVAVGTRATAFAPVQDLGLVVVWDDGDDLHAEPRAPYPHVREVLALRAHLTGAGVLVGGHARTAEAQLLLDTGWARPLEPPREQVRAWAPVVDGTGEEQLARDPGAQAARLPAVAFDAARRALADGAPVLVQVPRRGYVPSLACARDRTPARCPACAGPLAAPSERAVAACRWCGRLAGDWQCPQCEGRRLRAAVVGAGRTAEELGRAFPGTPVRTSGRDGVLARVGAEPALVVSTPGAEPVADGGYGAVLLLDGWAALGRADLRAGEEALRRWFAAAALARPAPAGRVVVVADRALPPVQALIRWDPAGAASRELAERTALGFPPAVRMASVEGPPTAVAELLRALPEGVAADVLGPVPAAEGLERVLLRAPRTSGADLAGALKAAAGVRSARKAEPVRIELDPRTLA